MKQNRSPQTFRQLERDLNNLFSGGRQRSRPTEPAAQSAPAYVVHVGTDGQIAYPAPGFEHLQAEELGRYPTLASAEAAKQAYNAAHPDADAYAWTPEQIRKGDQ